MSIPAAAAAAAPPRRMSPRIAGRALLGEADQVQRGQRGAAHGVDVAEGVGRGDPAEVEGVVHDRGEEVGRQDQREIVAQAIDRRVVRGRAADQHRRIARGR